MYELHLKGFKTKKQVKAFLEWYECQGEQDASIWFGRIKSEGKLNVQSMDFDVQKEPEWKENALTAFVKPKQGDRDA